MKFLDNKSAENKWIKVGAIWVGKTKQGKEMFSISLGKRPMELTGKEKFQAYRNDNAGMGVEKKGKPVLNKAGKQITYPDYNIFVVEE